MTDTARVHAAAWQATFDRHLPRFSAEAGVEHVPFDLVEDYQRHMDGRLRYDAAARFLASRRITLPYGSVSDPPGTATVCGVANDKHAAYLATLEAGGVDVYPATIALIRELRRHRVGLALVSSSRDCAAVMQKVGLGDAFDVVVGGVQMAHLGLPGKPDPSAFLEAGRRLGVSPPSGVVVEDAVVGVQAARAAGFGLVVGLAHNNPASVRADLAHAADVVIGELDELDVSTDGAAQ